MIPADNTKHPGGGRNVTGSPCDGGSKVTNPGQFRRDRLRASLFITLCLVLMVSWTVMRTAAAMSDMRVIKCVRGRHIHELMMLLASGANPNAVTVPDLLDDNHGRIAWLHTAWSMFWHVVEPHKQEFSALTMDIIEPRAGTSDDLKARRTIARLLLASSLSERLRLS